MKIKSVFEPAFLEYGQVVTGYDFSLVLDILENKTELPEGVIYVPSEPLLEETEVFLEVQNNAFGGMPIQFGYCNGHNTKLNCLEYHRDSEINIGTRDFVLLLAKQTNISNGKLHTSTVEAFSCPAGVAVELFATSLHYAPCKTDGGFKVMVVLPKGTNTDKPEIKAKNQDDLRLFAKNKWLLAHKDTSEAENGAYVGLEGKNIDISL